MYDEYYTTDFNGYGVRPVILTINDRFERVNNFLSGLQDYCQRPVQDHNSLIISKYGEVWMNDSSKMTKDRLLKNHLADGMRSVRQVSDVNNIEKVLRNEEYTNRDFSIHIQELLEAYGTLNVYPEFFGIEIEFIASNHFARVIGLVKIMGPDSETFYNARTLMGD